VEWLVTDVAGTMVNCVFTVTVTDNERPVIACPANIARNTDSGQCSATLTYGVTATDNHSATTTRTKGLPTGSVFPKGSTLVEWLATDVVGLTATCAFTVTVTDIEKPTII